jgi:hypothetical protein
MYPPLFAIVSVDLTVRTVFGTNPVRVFPFSGAPENVTLPYAVWQTIGGSPENYVGNAPDIDSFFVQVDVYATTAASARDGAEALRDAIEPRAYIVAWRGESKDPATQHYRYSFDVNFFTAR